MLRHAGQAAAGLVLLLAGCRNGAPETEVADGLDALAAGRNQLAVRRLSRAARHFPESSSLQYNLGTAYWLLDRPEEALQAFGKATRMDPTEPQAWLFKGHLLSQSGRWEEARLAFGTAVNQGGRTPHALTATAMVEFGLGNPDQAREYLVEALALERNYPPALYNLARLYEGDFANPELAIDLYSSFYRACDDPEWREKAHARMLVLQNNLTGPAAMQAPPDLRAAPGAGRPEQSREAPRTATTDRQEGAMTRALAYYRDSRWREAADECRRVLELSPGNSAAWQLLGRSLNADGKTQEAIAAFRRAAELSPANLDLLYIQAVLLRQQGDLAAAGAMLDRILAQDSGHAQSYLLMAYIRYEQGNYRAARGHLSRFLELSPDGDIKREAREWLERIPSR